MQTFSKRVRDRDQAGAEAAGLRWLGEATDAVVNVVSADGLEIVTAVSYTHLTLPTTPYV